jgi:hypothetical protein
MSMNSNDPFNNPNAAPGPNRGQVTYAEGDFAQPPAKKSRKGLWIGCGLVGFLGVLVCCGGLLLMIPFVMTQFGEMVRSEVEDSPTIVEHIGEIESISFSFSQTISEAENAQPGQGTPLTYDIQGTKGSGQIVVVQSQSGQEIDSAVLITSDGTRIPIELTDSAAEFEEIEMELDDLIESGTAEQ